MVVDLNSEVTETKPRMAGEEKVVHRVLLER